VYINILLNNVLKICWMFKVLQRIPKFMDLLAGCTGKKLKNTICILYIYNLNTQSN